MVEVTEGEIVLGSNPGRARLGEVPRSERTAKRQDAPTHPVPGLEEDHVVAGTLELVSRHEARDSGADDRHRLGRTGAPESPGRILRRYRIATTREPEAGRTRRSCL